ncbi:MAG: sulfatase [Kordiimonadaceae bacterium]|jgi:arylsulfatase A-like enzyme|nr:sulfatase [Kordiimonadaceae bacterium]MBT6033824.1 sulfatase [Kordiimonadaceae bacterium]
MEWRINLKIKFILIILLFSITGMGGSAFAQQKPNIVLILSDDHAWNDYSFMGHPDVKTPRIDELAARGVLFRRGYVPTGLCRPSLMTLATGQYASDHGVTGNDPNPITLARKAEMITFVEKFETLPELLAEQGYLSHQSGKWWEGSYQHGGFTHGMTRGFPEEGGRHGDDGLAIGREGMEPVTDFVDMAVEQDKPFFLWYAPFLPHSPHNPPDRLLKKYLKEGRSVHIAQYYAMIEWFDETNGQLIDYIDKKGLTDNTLFIYVADNGWIQSEDNKGFALRSKQTSYEAGVRTPIFFTWGEKLKTADRPELVSSIDLFPTMLAVAGARTPEGIPGLNILPNLTSGEEITRKAIFGESFAHDVVELDNPEATLLYRWVIEGKWKLLLTYDGTVSRNQTVHPRTEKRPQLYDLIADPYENNNLAKDNPDIVAKMAKQISDWKPLKQAKTITTW